MTPAPAAPTIGVATQPMEEAVKPVFGGIEEFSIGRSGNNEALVTLSVQSESGIRAEQSIKMSVVVDVNDNPTMLELQKRTLMAARDWLAEHIKAVERQITA